MSDIEIDPNEVINDLLQQVQQLTANNTMLRVGLNTANKRIVELSGEVMSGVKAGDTEVAPSSTAQKSK